MRLFSLCSVSVAAILGCALGCGDDGSGAIDAAPQATDAAPQAIDGALPAAPVLTDVTVTSATVGTSITLNGLDLGTATGTVAFGTQAASVSAWTDTSIEVTVPDVFPGVVKITAQNSVGTSNGLDFQVILPPAIYLETADRDVPNTLLALSFDRESNDIITPMTGSPFALGSPASTAAGCWRTVAVHEPTRRLFIGGSTTIDVLDIDPVTGVPSPATGSPITHSGTSGFGLSVEVSQAGDRLYVSYLDSIGVYDIGADGALTEVSGSPVTISGPTVQLTKLALHPGDGFLYVLGYDSAGDNGLLYTLAVGAPGASLLTTVGTPAVTPVSRYIGIRPGTEQLLQTTTAYGMLVWDLDSATGAPSQITGGPFSFTFPNSPINQYWSDMAVTTDGSRAFVGEFAAERLYVVDFAGDGSPTLLRDDFVPAAGAEASSCLHVSRDAQTLLTVSGFGHFGIYSLAGDGTATAVPNSPWIWLADYPQGFAATF